MSRERVEMLTVVFAAAIRSTTGQLEKVPEDKRMHQAQEGKGHPLWYAGHLAHGHDLIVNQWILGSDSVIPGDFGGKFAPGVMGGETPTGKADDYPSWDDIMSSFKAATSKTLELLEGISDEDLGGELKGEVPEQAKGLFGNLGDSLVSMALHDGHHRGQIALVCALD